MTIQEKRESPRVEGDLSRCNSVGSMPIRTGEQEALLRAIFRARVERLGKDVGAHVPGVRFHKRDDAVVDPLPHHHEASRLKTLLT